MDRISALSRLDLIDHARDENLKRLRELEQMLADAPLVAAAGVAFESEQKRLADLRANLRVRELEAQTLDAKINEIESRLYGGRVTNPKELDSLEKDRQMHVHLRGELDGKVLELMEGVDQAKKSAEQKEHAFKEAGQTRTIEVERFEREQHLLSARLAKLDAEYDQTRTSMDEEALKAYDRLRKNRGGRVISRLKNNSCGACGMEAPSGMVARVHAGEELVFCSACGRILAS